MSHFVKVDMLAVGNRHAMAILVVALIVFGTAIAYANNQIEQSRDSYLLAKKRVASNHDLTRNHLDALAFLEQHERAFLHWRSSGNIGPVDEVDWAELLLDASSIIGTQEFGNSFGEQEPLTELFGQKVQHLAIGQLTMNIEFKAKHGADVFRFFKDIRQRAPGPYVVDELKIERIEVKIPGHNRRSSIDKLELAAGDFSAEAQTVSLPVSDRLDKTGSEVSAKFGGVQVAAILRSFQIEMTD